MGKCIGCEFCMPDGKNGMVCASHENIYNNKYGYNVTNSMYDEKICYSEGINDFIERMQKKGKKMIKFKTYLVFENIPPDVMNNNDLKFKDELISYIIDENLDCIVLNGLHEDFKILYNLYLNDNIFKKYNDKYDYIYIIHEKEQFNQRELKFIKCFSTLKVEV
jgi:hypothetical protein